jgi:hypothetical protein
VPKPQPLSEEALRELEDSMGGVALPVDFRTFLAEFGWPTMWGVDPRSWKGRRRNVNLASTARPFPLARRYAEGCYARADRGDRKERDPLALQRALAEEALRAGGQPRELMCGLLTLEQFGDDSLELVVTGEQRGCIWAMATGGPGQMGLLLQPMGAQTPADTLPGTPAARLTKRARVAGVPVVDWIDFLRLHVMPEHMDEEEE